MKEKIKAEIDFLKKDNDKNFALALIFTTIILFIYCYFGSFSFFEKTFAGLENLSFWKIIYHNLMAFFLFFVIGTIYTRIFCGKVTNFGLGAGNYKLGLILCLIALPITALCGLSCVLDGGMTSTYPLIDLHTYNAWWQIILYFVSYFLYYVGWEFLFRGLLQFSAEKKCGVLCSILITTLISALIHTSIAGFGKPMVETLSAIPAGLIFGYIASKTRSIYPTLAIHFMVGVFTDLFIFLLV